MIKNVSLKTVEKTYSSISGRIQKEEELDKILKQLASMDVLVGIPEETTERSEGEMTNAQLLAIHTKGVHSMSMDAETGEGSSEIEERYNNAMSLYISSHGSPLWRIPPRPLIEPALKAEDNAQRIAEDLRIVAQNILSKKISQAKRAMKTAGQDAVNMIRAWFDDPRNGWAPNAPSTIRAKLKKKYKSEKKREQVLGRIMSGEAGLNTPLVDTGEMKKSITFVVRENGVRESGE